MLRPEKGEGERPAKFHKSIKKAPLIFTTALLVGFPLCLGQAALASTSSFGLDRLQDQSQTALGTLKQSQPKSYQGSRLLSSTSLPSESEISSLESILSGYKSKLTSLRAQASSRPDLAATVNPLIAGLQSEVANLEQDIATAKSLRAAYIQNQETLTKAINAYNDAVLAETSALLALDNAKAALASKEQALTDARSTLVVATSTHDTAVSNLASAQAALALATAAKSKADSDLADSTSANSTAIASLANANTNLAAAQASLATAIETESQAQSLKDQAQDAYLTLASQLTTANAQLATAQANYRNNLMPDPSWTAPTQEVQVPYQVIVPHTEIVTTTTLVPRVVLTPVTTTQTVPSGLRVEMYDRLGYNNAPPLPTAYETPVYTSTVPNVDFNWGGGYILNTQYSEDVILKFTGYISVPTDGYYQFYTPADDGTQLYINNQLLTNDWRDKGGGGTISAQVYLTKGQSVPVTLYYYENGGGAKVGFYTYSPNQGFQIIPASWFGEQTTTTTTYIEETVYDEVTTSEEVTTYTIETRYRTEIQPVITQQTITVQIDEGGQATFTAPQGATFISSNLRYEAKDRPECGVNIYPNLQGLSTITLQANNGVYGDPCGGWYKHITGTLTYNGAPTAPMIPNPDYLAPIAQAQAVVDQLEPAVLSAFSILQLRDTALSNASTAKSTAAGSVALQNASVDTATAAVSASGSALDAAQAAVRDADAAFDTATQAADKATTEKNTAAAALSNATTLESTATTNLAQATVDITNKTDLLTSAQAVKASSLETKASADDEASVAQTSYSAALGRASSRRVDFTKAEEVLASPAPVEEGSKEIPAELSAENLMSVDLKKIDPTELTAAQADQLVAAALETFQTAEAGSPEYAQALDALFLAAQQDDIVLDPALAAIPGLQAAAELVNFLGNAGADMSPQVREQSKKIVVAAVVAAGTALQAAAGAAVSSASASSSSGGTSRKNR